jgi:flavin reductase (DIM6/NTAB) family NADH-FMN oxidoreductase RutF
MRFDFTATSQRDIYNLIIGLVAPRPIALVTTLNENGSVNAAPFSSFNYLCLDPPILGLGIAAKGPTGDEVKDTARNIQRSGEFVVNVVSEDIARQMNICAVDFPSSRSEVDMAGLTTAASAVVKVPRIKESHASMECRLFETIIPKKSRIILGEVVAAYVEDPYVDPKGPYIRAEELHALGRMNGGGHYVHTREAFLTIPRISFDDWEKGKRG